MTTTIRAFVAIDVPDEIKRTVSAVSEQLAVTLPERSVRWVKPNAMHLTLRFLGDTAETLVPALGDALDTAVAGHAAFTLRLGELGTFPNPQRPRVVWLGVVPVPPAPDEALRRLKTSLDEALLPLGWEMEQKPFTAHLTLGRVRDGGRLTLPARPDVPPASFRVTAIHLIESDLRPDGPRYRLRHRAALGPA